MELIMLHLWLPSPADFSISWAVELLPCCLPSEIEISETDCGYVLLIDVYVCERIFAHHYILWGCEPYKSFGLCQFLLLQRKADRKCLCRWRRFLQGDRTLFLFCNVILWWALDFLPGIHETSFWIQGAISGWCIASKQLAQAEEYILVATFFWSHVCSYPSCSFAKYTGEEVCRCKYVLFIC